MSLYGQFVDTLTNTSKLLMNNFVSNKVWIFLMRLHYTLTCSNCISLYITYQRRWHWYVVAKYRKAQMDSNHRKNM